MSRKWFPAAITAKLLLLALLLPAAPAAAGALTDFGSLPAAMRQQVTGLYIKGAGVNTWYALEVDPATGNLPFSFGGDQNYGVVGVNTLRTAAQIGNATGAADFGQGAVSAQTLRTVSVLSNGTAALATGAGTTGSTVLRVVLPTDQTAVPVTGTFWQATQPVSAASLPLPTGAATAAKQPALGTAGTPSSDVITVQGVSSMTALKVDGSAVTQPVSGTVTANQGGTWNVTNVSGTVSLPTGAATSALQTTGNTTLSAISGQLPATLGAKATATSVAVNIASDQTVPVSIAAAPLAPTGRTSALVYRNSYSSVNVTTSAYVQVVASTAAAINRLYVFDSSGSAMKIATGTAGSEVDKLYIPPGGSGVPYEITIPASTRVAIEALDANATSGQIIITGLN